MNAIPRMCALSVFVGACLARAAEGYPSPEQAGFHHCALIYDRPARGVRELTPYVIRTEADGETRPGEWLFDSFLFLVYSLPGGLRTEIGATRQADWQYCLDRWFAPDRDLGALDEAIARAAKGGPAPPPRQVILMIPYMNRTVREFGDVDGDGQTEDLATPEGRDRVIAWYREQAVRRFAAAGYRHLRLWGFYWMGEGVRDADIPVVRAVADMLHAEGHRFLWIPWFSAPGWERWREMGFDVAIMQPNYAFQSSTHKGRVRRNRLAVTAQKARDAGMGVEMEAGAVLVEGVDRQPFRNYLVDGAPDRLGYQNGAMAYYLGGSVVEEACHATDPGQRACYELLADYVSGRAVRDPLAPVGTENREQDGKLVLSGCLPVVRALGAMDLLLDEPPGTAPWLGTAAVRVRADAASPWIPAGWAVRTGTDAKDGRWQVLTVPMDARALAFEVELTAFAGAPLPAPDRIRPDPVDAAGLTRHAAFGATYAVDPLPEAIYGDTPARLLTDGIVPPEGWGKGRTVGWHGGKLRVAVTLDLGRELPIDQVEIHGPGGGHGGVQFASQATVLLGGDRPLPPTGAGLGKLPKGILVGVPDPWRIGLRRAENDMDGCLPVSFPVGARGRYVSIGLQGSGWLMLSEIRVISAGENVALGLPYALQPSPTAPRFDAERHPDENLRYPDDGTRLVDGVVAKTYSRGGTVGWIGAGERTVVLDLGESKPLRRILVWSLRGGSSGVYAPEQISVWLSPDGAAWGDPVPALAPPGPPEDGKTLEAVAFAAESPARTTARFLKIRIRQARGWTMLSEVEVQAQN